VKELNVSEVRPDVIDRYHLNEIPIERASTPMAEFLRLDGLCAVVTGAGGDGLGNAICHRLAEQGATVAVWDVDRTMAESAVKEVTQRWGTEAFPIVADVGNWREVRSAVAEIAERIGRIDILVSNAGGSGGLSRSGERVVSGLALSEMTQAQIDLTISINLTGAIYVVQAVVERMLGNGRGRIILISSEGARAGVIGASVYTACKAGLIGLTQSLAQELGPKGITSVCVAPGLMLGQQHLRVLSEPGSFRDTLDRTYERASIGRASIADEVAGVVAYLASQAGSYAHGTTISVGGGMSI
jgi:NAD(P)-dependent dehydrogenase (short-subunit alcohol dehydrogenase family)